MKKLIVIFFIGLTALMLASCRKIPSDPITENPVWINDLCFRLIHSDEIGSKDYRIYELCMIPSDKVEEDVFEFGIYI